MQIFGTISSSIGLHGSLFSQLIYIFFLVGHLFFCQSPIDFMKRCFLPLWEPSL